ncbi:6103_t:CDS:1, partial [Gigaspora rosea]
MTTQTRKIWVVEKAGTFENFKQELEELPPPPPNHVRIKVKCIGLNYADIFLVL